MLQELITKGYVICSVDCQGQKYRILKKYFPTIQRTRYGCCSIIFLDDKSHLAVQAFLRKIRKNIISYQELKNITKIFNIELNKNEKKEFIGKKQLEKH